MKRREVITLDCNFSSSSGLTLNIKLKEMSFFAYHLTSAALHHKIYIHHRRNTTFFLKKRKKENLLHIAFVDLISEAFCRSAHFFISIFFFKQLSLLLSFGYVNTMDFFSPQV